MHYCAVEKRYLTLLTLMTDFGLLRLVTSANRQRQGSCRAPVMGTGKADGWDPKWVKITVVMLH